jgi:hypothetical protein
MELTMELLTEMGQQTTGSHQRREDLFLMKYFCLKKHVSTKKNYERFENGVFANVANDANNTIVVNPGIGVWQGVAMDSLKLYPGPPCPTHLPPTGRPPLKWTDDHLRGGLSPGRTASGCLLPFRTSHAVRL